MPDSTRSTIHIDAEPGAVLDVIADFEAYPEWAEQVKEAVVLAEDGDGWADQVEYVLDAGAIKDTYVLEYDWNGILEDGSGSVSWHLVRATILKALNGTYYLDNEAGGTRVVYELEVDVKIPMIGMLKRKAEKIITDTALHELKRRVEGLAG
jgi:ribosome-associated toxin RatA of RatAB toxin-antitoxin module